MLLPAIGNNYRTMASSLSDVEIHLVDRFATADRVTDETIVRFTLTGDGFKNAPVPIGSKVELRLVHIFERRDGKIAREKVCECWQVLKGHGR